MERNEGFARGRIFGVDYVCSCGKALVYRWDPMSDDDRAEVPDVVFANGHEYKVECFVDGLFSKSAIRSVSIPNTVKSLPKKCFEFCENLVNVTFMAESQICSFGDACFKRCGLSEIEVPDSCISIGSKCFDGCTQLRHVGISERSELSTIGKFAFRGCSIFDLYLPKNLVFDTEQMVSNGIFFGIKSVNIGNNGNVVMSNDCLISKDERVLIHCFSNNSTLEVPDSIRLLWFWCFAGSEVRKVVFRTKPLSS